MTKTAKHSVTALLAWGAFVAACGGGGSTGAPELLGTGGSGGIDGTGGTGGSGGSGGTGGVDLDPVSRGKYLVDHVLACGDCHTQRDAAGDPLPGKYLAGSPCVIDLQPDDDAAGCLPSRNLTNHPTGLSALTDDQIKEAFLNGVQPEGQAIYPVMPYPSLHNMSAADADAIVAYLRTVPGVDQRKAPPQPPFDVPFAAPLPPLDMSKVPQPDPAYPDQEAARRGRYLAAEMGACIDCHTPTAALTPDAPLIIERAFWGGRLFPTRVLGLPSPPLPILVAAGNLTPDVTGTQGYTVQGLVEAMRRGVDQKSEGPCPPMPAGPRGAFAGLRDGDAADIAHYLLSLPPATSAANTTCSVPVAARR
jgi:mono/diheme cytochrome c family protein